MIREDVWTMDCPALYELHYDHRSQMYVSLSSEAYAALMERLTAEHRQVRMVGQGFALPPFICPTEPDWGFGPVLVRVPDKNSWPTWRIHLPTSRDGEIAWSEVAATSATLGALFNFLRWQERVPISPRSGLRRQLIFFNGWVCAREEKGGAFGAIISPAMAGWIEAQSHNSLEGVAKEAMMRAYERMKCADDFGLMRVQKGERGRIFLQQSTQCAFTRSMMGDSSTPGYEMQDHNIDSPFQTLVFFAALAALHQAARDDGV